MAAISKPKDTSGAPGFLRGPLGVIAVVGVFILAGGLAPASASAGGTTELVNIGYDGSPSDGETRGLSSVSADGRYVAYSSTASNVVVNDTNGQDDVFVFDRQDGSTERVSVSSNGTEAQGGWSANPALSADGRYVAFTSRASNLVPNDTNGENDIFVRDLQLDTTRRVSVSSSGQQGAGFGSSGMVAISADGGVIAFSSDDTNLVPGDNNNLPDVFVRDGSSTERVSVPGGGGEANGYGFWFDLSDDGNRVVFESTASNLVPNDNNGHTDVFLRDRSAGTTQRVSVTDDESESLRGGGDVVGISGAGDLVLFTSDSSNLVPGDTNGNYDVFVRDLTDGTTQRVSVTDTGAQVAGAAGGSISQDGRFVAFEGSDDLIPQSPGNGNEDIFVHDLQSGTNERVSVSSTGVQQNGNSSFTSMSSTGRFVAFESTASNLVPSGSSGIFLRDRSGAADRDGDGIPDASDTCPDVAGISPSGCPAQPARSYVALGDSVAAGEGINYGYEWRSTGPSEGHWDRLGQSNPNWSGAYQDCHQSESGYPHIVAADLSLTLTDLACTGSSADNGILVRRTGGDEAFPPNPQLGDATNPSPEYTAAQPDLVSLTLGANDVGFRDIVIGCYFSGDCNPNFARLAQQRSGLRQTLESIQAQGTAVGKMPLVVITAYYNPFPRLYPQFGQCRDINLLGDTGWASLSNAEIGTLVNGLTRLNQNIRDVALDFPNVVVATPPSFKDNAWCSADPWAYGTSIARDYSASDLSISPAPFHPTPQGQQAIASAVKAIIDNGRSIPLGPDVGAQTSGGVGVRFDEVTSTGTLVAADTEVPPADRFVMAKAFDLTTSARHAGSIHLSVPASAPGVLYHYVNGSWQAVADSTFDGERITGTVQSLSPFAVGVPTLTVVADFTASGAGPAPAAVSFDATSSTVEGGDNLEYTWDFGDGSSGSGATPTHTYSRSGSYAVELTVTSEAGAEDVAQRSVEVTNLPPNAVANGPSHGEPGETLEFDGSGTTDQNGVVASYVWDFGDGTDVVTGPMVTHAFSVPGTYQVELQAIDDEGAAASAIADVEISDTVAPETTIDSGPTGTITTASASFAFSSSEAGSAFKCVLDARAAEACVSPKTYSGLTNGLHTFSVTATDATENIDPIPASRTFSVQVASPLLPVPQPPLVNQACIDAEATVDAASAKVKRAHMQLKKAKTSLAKKRAKSKLKKAKVALEKAEQARVGACG